MFDIHYSVIYNKILFEELVDNIKKYSLSQNEFDLYFKKYLESKIPKKYYCTNCGCEITKYSKSKLCNKCSRKQSRKPNRPDYQTLLLDIKNFGYTGTGVKYSVSDSCIKKWLKVYQKTYNFEIPIIKTHNHKSYCEKCGVEITKNKTNLCSICYKQIAKDEMISKEDLSILMRTKTFSEIREIINKPRTTIIRWCNYYDIPYKKSDYKL